MDTYKTGQLYNQTSVQWVVEKRTLYTQAFVKCPVIQQSFLELSIVQMSDCKTGQKCLVSVFQLSSSPFH